MATKKQAVDPHKKLLITAIKKTVNRNTVLPILEYVYLSGENAIVTDLENSVVIPFKTPHAAGVCVPSDRFIDCMEMMDEPNIVSDKNFAVEFQEGKRKIKVMGDNPDQFPKIPLLDQAYPVIGKLNQDDMELLETALCFVSNDDLRPSMTGVLLGKEIVATDAHRLFWHDLSKPVKSEFILPAKAAKILLSFGGEWVLSAEKTKKNEAPTYVCFAREDGVKLITRAIDARYPDYKVVIPTGKPYVTLEAPTELLLKEVKSALKFSNRSTNQVTFGMNGEFSILSQDVDFSFEYNNEFPNKEDFNFDFAPDMPKQYEMDGAPVNVVKDHGAVVEIRGEYSYSDPVKVMKKDLTELPPSLYIAFNGKFLHEIVSKTPKGSNVEFAMWSPTKCAIINKHFLVMPLMLNQ